MDWPLWSAAAVLGLLGLWLTWRGLLRDRSRGRPRCPRCWYDMTGSATLTCPECGHDAGTRRRLHKTRRRWGVALLGVLLMLCTLYSLPVDRRMKEHGESLTQALVPTPVLGVLAAYRDIEAYERLRTRLEPGHKWPWQRWLLIWAAGTRIDSSDHLQWSDPLQWPAWEDLWRLAREGDARAMRAALRRLDHPQPEQRFRRAAMAHRFAPRTDLMRDHALARLGDPSDRLFVTYFVLLIMDRAGSARVGDAHLLRWLETVQAGDEHAEWYYPLALSEIVRRDGDPFRQRLVELVEALDPLDASPGGHREGSVQPLGRSAPFSQARHEMSHATRKIQLHFLTSLALARMDAVADPMVIEARQVPAAQPGSAFRIAVTVATWPGQELATPSGHWLDWWLEIGPAEPDEDRQGAGQRRLAQVVGPEDAEPMSYGRPGSSVRWANFVPDIRRFEPLAPGRHTARVVYGPSRRWEVLADSPLRIESEPFELIIEE